MVTGPSPSLRIGCRVKGLCWGRGDTGGERQSNHPWEASFLESPRADLLTSHSYMW